jgi:hypothetical protein
MSTVRAGHFAPASVRTRWPASNKASAVGDADRLGHRRDAEDRGERLSLGHQIPSLFARIDS